MLRQNDPQPQKQAATPPIVPPASAVTAATTAPPPVAKTPAVALPRPSPKERAAARKHADQTTAQAKQNAVNAHIEAAIKQWEALPLEETRKAVLTRAEAKRADEVAWSRSLDNKVSPILAVAGFSIGGLLTLLNGLNSKDGSFLTGKPLVTGLLIGALLSLFYAAVMSVKVISPTLHLPKPIQHVFGRIPLFGERHKPQETGWTGHLFFGHTAKYKELDTFIGDAITHFASEGDVLRDTLEQGFINAHLNTEKSKDIALAVRGVLVAIGFLLLAGGAFFFQWWAARFAS